MRYNTMTPRFDSILVRLKGFMKAIDILYRVLMTRGV